MFHGNSNSDKSVVVSRMKEKCLSGFADFDLSLPTAINFFSCISIQFEILSTMVKMNGNLQTLLRVV